MIFRCSVGSSGPLVCTVVRAGLRDAVCAEVGGEGCGQACSVLCFSSVSWALVGAYDCLPYGSAERLIVMERDVEAAAGKVGSGEAGSEQGNVYIEFVVVVGDVGVHF